MVSADARTLPLLEMPADTAERFRLQASSLPLQQVRINEESKNALMDKYSLDGFPSYLFFDKGHKLIHAQTAFPGLDRYRVLLDQITGK